MLGTSKGKIAFYEVKTKGNRKEESSITVSLCLVGEAEFIGIRSVSSCNSEESVCSLHINRGEN